MSMRASILVHCIKSLSFVALGSLQASVIDLLLLGVAAPWTALREGETVEPSQGRLWRSSSLIVRGHFVHLTGVVKSNSSEIEIWRSLLIQASSRSR